MWLVNDHLLTMCSVCLFLLHAYGERERERERALSLLLVRALIPSSGYRSTSLIAQSCLTLCYSLDCSPPGYSVHGILQARILEWVAISSSRGSSRHGDGTHIPCIARWILNPCHQGSPEMSILNISESEVATPWTVAYQTPLSMGFSRQ